MFNECTKPMLTPLQITAYFVYAMYSSTTCHLTHQQDQLNTRDDAAKPDFLKLA